MIWKHERIEQFPSAQRVIDRKARYHGLLQLALEVALTPGSKIPDLRNLLSAYEPLVDQASKDERRAIMATYVLFYAFVAPEDRTPASKKNVDRFKEQLQERSIESMTLDVLLMDDVHGELQECMAAYEAYATSRFSERTLEVPPLIEAKLLAAIANKALAKGDVEQHARLLEIAVGEVPSNTEIQARLAESRATGIPVDLAAIFTLPISMGRAARSTPVNLLPGSA